MPNDHEQTNLQAAATPADGSEGAPRGRGRGQRPEASPASDLDAIKAELRAEMKAELDAAKAEIRDQAREQLNEEREILHAQVDAAKAEALEARQQVRSRLKPADFGTTTLMADDTVQSPTQRRAARPLPLEGIVELELVHGSFLGDTLDRKFRHEAGHRDADEKTGAKAESWDGPALPGEVLRFDMKNPVHKKNAQLIRDSGCAERV